MKLWKVVHRIDGKLWSAISHNGLMVEYATGTPSNGVTEEQHGNALGSYYYPDFVDGLFVFTELEKAKFFMKQWKDREIWECTADVVQTRANGVAIVRNVVLVKKVEIKEKKVKESK